MVGDVADEGGGVGEDEAENAVAVNVGEEVEEVDVGEVEDDVTPVGVVSAARGEVAEAVADLAGGEEASGAAAVARNAEAVEGGVVEEAARSAGVDDGVAVAEAGADVVPVEEDVALAGAVPSVGAKSSCFMVYQDSGLGCSMFLNL